MNRSLFRITAYLQLGIAILLATGCAPTQPFFAHESADLQYYLNSATSIEYPDVEVESLAETTGSARPLTIGNHDYQFWDLSLEECVSIALQNAKLFVTTSGNAEFRQNVAETGLDVAWTTSGSRGGSGVVETSCGRTDVAIDDINDVLWIRWADNREPVGREVIDALLDCSRN